MKNEDIAALRSEYAHMQLTKRSVHADPMAQFSIWFDEAVAANVMEPNAMTLATADTNGQPSARIVLLKGLELGGFVFYTNYSSAKGQQLKVNPAAALLFFWPELERQVRIEGSVDRVSKEVSDKYFSSRLFESQVGAIASDQSSVLRSRDELEEHVTSLLAKLSGTTPDRPEDWGGYVLRPKLIEFWQGRESRLHDRIQYTIDGDTWTITRLAP